MRFTALGTNVKNELGIPQVNRTRSFSSFTAFGFAYGISELGSSIRLPG